MKECIRCSFAVLAILLLATPVPAQQSCCQPGTVNSSSQWFPAQSCCPAYQPCPTNCPTLVLAQPTFPQTTFPQTTFPQFSGTATCPVCNPTWQQAAISQHSPPIRMSQFCPEQLPTVNPGQSAQPTFAFNGLPSRKCQGKLSKEEARAMQQTFTNNPNASHQQRMFNCYRYCNANFPDYPCNGECHQSCPDFYLETCECDCIPSHWGEICYCLNTYSELEFPPGGE